MLDSGVPLKSGSGRSQDSSIYFTPAATAKFVARENWISWPEGRGLFRNPESCCADWLFRAADFPGSILVNGCREFPSGSRTNS